MIARNHAHRSCSLGFHDIIASYNGNNLRVGGNDQAGNPVVQRANIAGNGDPVCFHQTGTSGGGHPEGYFAADDNGNRFGVGSSCSTGVNWLNTTGGTIWIYVPETHGFHLDNVHCGGELTSDNVAQHQWTRRTQGCSGCYQLLGVIAPGNGPARTMALREHGAMIARTPARVCSTYNISWQNGTEPEWTKIHWTCNGHRPRWWVRAVSHCQDGRNNIIYAGRWVEYVGSVSEASCTSAYPLLAGSGYDAKQCSACSFRRNWVHGTPAPAIRAVALTAFARSHHLGRLIPRSSGAQPQRRTTIGRVCTHNGNPECFGDDGGIYTGDRMVQEKLADARNITWTRIDSNCGGQYLCERAYLSFSVNGDRIGVLNAGCDGSAYVRNPGEGTGTVWWDFPTSSGTDIIESQLCQPFVLETDNNDEARWITGNQTAGLYWQLDEGV
jgi:hypothetical protein